MMMLIFAVKAIAWVAIAVSVVTAFVYHIVYRDERKFYLSLAVLAVSLLVIILVPGNYCVYPYTDPQCNTR